MIKTKGLAVEGPHSPFINFEFTRRDLDPHDVLIDIHYCGICHSDIHQVKNEWNNSTYPMVPGHEIVGVVKSVGDNVTKFKVGDTVGVGCFVDSCGECSSCQAHEEQFCQIHTVLTYNSTEMDLKTNTYGGYSKQIVVKDKYVLHIDSNLNMAQAAPLLCAGITTYSPLKRFKVKSGQQVAIVGLGGLGHMAVKFAVAMGAEVTVFSTSPQKEVDAKKLGAHHFVVSKNPDAIQEVTGKFHFILDTVSANHEIDTYLNLLRPAGVMVLVGAPEKPLQFSAFSLIAGKKTLAGSLIGGIKETQEMLDYCAKHHISSDIELISPSEIASAYERTIKGDVRYRFVLDMHNFQ